MNLFCTDRRRLTAAARALSERGFDVELQAEGSEHVHRIRSTWLSTDAHGKVHMLYTTPFLCPVITHLEATSESTLYESRYVEELVLTALGAAGVDPGERTMRSRGIED